MNIKTERQIQNRFALLIGVSEYADPFFERLPQTANDVMGLETLLSQYGYTVRTLHYLQSDPGSKPTKKNIRFELKHICEKVGPGDLLLVHFGGHGALENKKAYLAPSDVDKSNLEESAIDLEEFKKEIQQADGQVKILFLDACHSGIGRDTEGMSYEFERHIFLESEGTATLSACMRHEIAYNHDTASNGVFSYYLLEGLKGNAVQNGKRFITFDDLKNYVTDKVKTWAEARRKKQTPNASSHLVGDPPLLKLEGPDNSFNKKFCGEAAPHNPFTDTLAIRDPLRFIGRETETRRLWTLLNGGSVTLRGDSKIGKSSMLWNLAQKWQGKKIGPINFDQLSNVDDFYEYIARALELKSNSWSAICQALENIDALLLLDELDISPKRGITHDDMSHFRAVCESNRHFKIVAVSRAPLKEVFPDTGKGSPFYNLLQPFALKPLTRDNALKLLEHPWAPEMLKFDPATCDELLISASIATEGYHPFKLQRAAFHHYENLIDNHYNWKEAFKNDMEQML